MKYRVFNDLILPNSQVLPAGSEVDEAEVPENLLPTLIQIGSIEPVEEPKPEEPAKPERKKPDPTP